MNSYRRILGTGTALALMLMAGGLMADMRPPDLLIAAYGNLANANHDYDGHRVAAMKQIEGAAKVLGIDLHGSNKVHERQAESDAQMHEAKRMLEQARRDFAERDRKKIEEHLSHAIHEINVALNIK